MNSNINLNKGMEGANPNGVNGPNRTNACC